MVSAKSRQVVSWTLSVLVHIGLLVSLNSLTLAGGRPGPDDTPGSHRAVTLTLGRAAPQARGGRRVVDSTAPPAKTASRPASRPEQPPTPTSKPHPRPDGQPGHHHRPATPEPKPRPTPQPQRQPAPKPSSGQKPDTRAANRGPNGSGGADANHGPQVARSRGNQASAQGRPGNPGAGSDSSGDQNKALDRYLAKVRDTIEYNKVYPARARLRGQQGEVAIRFRIDRNGHARKVTLARSSHSDILDRESLNLVRRLHFPAPPKALRPDEPISVTIPIRYRL